MRHSAAVAADTSASILFENTVMQTHKDPNISVRDFKVICSIIGQPVLLDAARFGAGAHRLRNFWTNLALPHHLTCCAEEIHRNPNRFADMWLDPCRKTINAVHSDVHPFYPCNKRNERHRAFPTLVAFPISRAFRDLNAGTVYDCSGSRLSSHFIKHFQPMLYLCSFVKLVYTSV
jgi:hypothetical protein